MCLVHHCHQSRRHLPDRLLPTVQQMPREGNYHLHYHHLLAYQSNANSKTRLEARIVPVEPWIARRRSSSWNPKEAPAKVEARQIWAAVASAGQVRNWLDATEARRLKRSIDHRCRVMSREEGGECRTTRHRLQCCTARHGLRYRTSRHGLLKMMPYMKMALVRAWLSRSLRGNAPPRRTADTLRAAGEPDLPQLLQGLGC